MDEKIINMEWKFITGTNKKYQISNNGSVRSVGWKTTHKDGKITTHKPRLLKQQSWKGYRSVTINICNSKKTLKIHRLVATSFVSNPKKLNIVNHIDGMKSNNQFTNLEWTTHQGNVDHAWKNNLCEKVSRKGSNNGISKLTEKQVLEIRRKYIPRIYTRDILAKEYGVTISCIKDILIKRRWKHI